MMRSHWSQTLLVQPILALLITAGGNAQSYYTEMVVANESFNQWHKRIVVYELHMDAWVPLDSVDIFDDDVKFELTGSQLIIASKDYFLDDIARYVVRHYSVDSAGLNEKEVRVIDETTIDSLLQASNIERSANLGSTLTQLVWSRFLVDGGSVVIWGFDWTILYAPIRGEFICASNPALQWRNTR